MVEVAPVRVAVLRHRGDPAGVGESVRRFVAWRKATGLSPDRSSTFNVLHDDPGTTPPAAFRLDLCAAIEGDVPPNSLGIVVGTLPGGRCAVLRHVGSETGLGPALSHLCADWLPRSGEARRDVPPYCQRVAFPPEVPEDQAVTDLFLPLR